MTAINSNRAIRGPVTAVPVVAGKGVRLVADTENNRIVAEADETVLYSNAAPEPIVTETQLNLSESYLNFELVRIYLRASGGNTSQSSYEIESQVFQSDGTELSCIPVSNGSGGLMCDSNVFVFATTATTKCTVKSSGVRLNISSTGTSTTNNRGASVYKIIGVNRIASA